MRSALSVALCDGQSNRPSAASLSRAGLLCCFFAGLLCVPPPAAARGKAPAPMPARLLCLCALGAVLMGGCRGDSSVVAKKGCVRCRTLRVLMLALRAHTVWSPRAVADPHPRAMHCRAQPRGGRPHHDRCAAARGRGQLSRRRELWCATRRRASQTAPVPRHARQRTPRRTQTGRSTSPMPRPRSKPLIWTATAC